MSAVQAGPEVDLSLLVRQVRWEAEGVVSVLLEDAGGADLPQWAPGAHIDLHLPGGATRQYSLCGDPSDRKAWRVAVLREDAGRGGSAAVHERVRPGTVLGARGPRNAFALAGTGPFRFVAGGIGITPILAMVRECEAQGVDWSLLYGGRSRGSMAFLSELTAYSGKVTLHPQDEAGLMPLGEQFGAPQPGTTVHACGPPAMLDALHGAMESWVEALRVERFVAVQATTEQLHSERAFDVEAVRSGVTVPVPVGTSIVRALEGVGIFPETSCEEGICGTCETGVVSGEVDHRDSLLSEAERAAGETMMICVSRCTGPRLRLDL